MFVYVCFQVQELGLQRAYSEDDAVYKYIRKLMALPFLPHRQISPMFLRLQIEAQTEPLQNLVTYIRRQWIESTVFLPKNWNVYQQAIRTNNDIEGQRSESSRERAVWFTSLLLDRAPRQRGETYSRHHQACIRKETKTGPAEAVSKPAGEAFRQLGEV